MYGGTKTEMERLLADAERFSGVHYDINNLNDVYQAIHVVQGEMQISGRTAEEAADIIARTGRSSSEVYEQLGTTAKEASTTIEGSVNSLKSSWQNLLTGLASGEQDLGKLLNSVLENAETVVNNVLPVVEKTLQNIIPVAEQALTTIISKITEYLPRVLELGSELVGTLVSSISKNLPEIARAGLEMAKSLIKGISQNISKIASELVKAVVEIADTLTSPKVLGELIDAGIELIMSLADGLIKAAPELIKAVPKLIKNLVQSLTSNVSKIVKAGIELFKGLIEAIPKIIPELVKAIPEIIGAIVGGLLDGAVEIGKAALEMFFGITDGADKATEKLKEHAAAMQDYLDKLSQLEPQLAGYDTLLSDHGRTIGQIDEKIRTAEQGITDTLGQALQTQQGLRDKDLETIRGYLDELNKLYEEKLGIYRDQQLGILLQTQAESDTITRETAQQMIVNAQAAYEESEKAENEHYQRQLAILENTRKANKEMTQEEYQAERAELARQHSETIAELEGYYNDTVGVVAGASERWVTEESAKWEQLNALTQAWNTETGDALADIVLQYGNFGAATQVSKEAYAKMLDDMNWQTTQGFLLMQTQWAAQGGVITEENKKMIANILGAFDNLPADLDSAGKDALLGLISGMEAYIPQLQDTSDKSANDIVDIIKRELEIGSPSQVMHRIGADTGEGLRQGIESKQGSILSQLSALAQNMKSPFSTMFSTFQTIGGQIASGISKGISDQEGNLLTKIRGIMQRITEAARAKVEIGSPSKVFAKIGRQMAQGLDVGWEKEIGGVTQNVRDSLEFGASSLSGAGSGSTGVLEEILYMLMDIRENMDFALVLDDGAIAGRIDRTLGKTAMRKMRGN